MTLARNVIVATLIAHSSFAFAKGKGGKPRMAIHPNQNDTGAWTFGVEANQYRDTTYLQPTVAYSAANGFDIAITSQNIPVWGGGAQNFEGDTYVQVSKTFKWNNTFTLIIGAQNGYALYADKIPGKMHMFDFAETEVRLTKHLKIHGGAFYVNAPLSTTTAYVGGLAGFELGFHDFVFRADYFGGHSNVSGASATLSYYAMKNANLYVGVGVPERDSGNEFYGIVGFQLSTGSLR